MCRTWKKPNASSGRSARLPGAAKSASNFSTPSARKIFERLRAVNPSLRIFYDAKFHDIPNTVAGAVRAASRYRPWMLNIHASGGRAMMEAAVEAAHQSEEPPLVIAVTVLTSLDQSVLSDELGVTRLLSDHVVALAKAAQQAGCDGVVASPREIASIKAACGRDFLVVTPGVRPAGSAIGDQKRVTTPCEAVTAGANYIVIGRPITAAPDPAAALRAVLEEIGFA